MIKRLINSFKLQSCKRKKHLIHYYYGEDNKPLYILCSTCNKVFYRSKKEIKNEN